MQIDDITKNLSDNLNSFLKFFTEKLHKKVLEIDTNAKSAKYYQQLTRVSYSLEQYVKKEVGLFYIGFLGSFSSGKSSTINSILDLWGSDKMRPNTKNPTDSFITLITNQANIQNVFTFAKEGAISIRTDTNFDLEILNKIVLMDTPGSGDPNIIESIVRDSLPLCDLIIYTLNATAPYTEVDKPFLLAQQLKLKNIPILFVLTRADDFKSDKKEILSQENFNEQKFKAELQTLIARINESLNVTDFTEDDFIIIDNIESFNIDLLKRKIESLTGKGEESLMVLHNHKLIYFKKEIEQIYKFYLELTDGKIEKCNKFWEKANSNIEYFDNQIEVSKIKFRSIWNDFSQRIMRVHDGTIKGYIDGLLTDLELVKPFIDSSEYTLLKEKMRNTLKIDSQIKSSSIIKEIEEKAFETITVLKQDLMNVINYESLTINLNQGEPAVDYSAKLLFPLDLSEFQEEYSESFMSLRYKNLNDLAKIYEQINRTLSQNKPIDSINDIMLNYKSSAIEVMDIYYQAIKMYNIVAFSLEVRNLISELGLAQEFDDIEAVEIDKAKYNLIVEKELLGNFENDSIQFLQAITVSLKDFESMNLTLEAQRKAGRKSLSMNSIPNEKVKVKNFANISEFVTGSYNDLISRAQNKLFSLKKEIAQLKRKRIIKYSKIFVGSLIAIAIAILCYYKIKNITAPTNLLATIFIGIGTSVIATLLTNFFDKYKIKKQKLIDYFKEILYKENSETLNNLYSDFKQRNIVLKKELEADIYSDWESIFSEIVLTLKTSEVLSLDSEITSAKKNITSVIEKYKGSYITFHNKLLSLFNYDGNILKINDIADSIKEDSIKPSFNLLTNTLTEIKSVKTEIGILKN